MLMNAVLQLVFQSELTPAPLGQAPEGTRDVVPDEQTQPQDESAVDGLVDGAGI
jgi:hypothetical protein